jgi:hypothetical protein
MNVTSSAGRPLQGWGRFAKNTGLALGHKGQSVLQDPMAFKMNALALSSLILVAGRVVVASFSAAKAQGTPDANYRAQESIRTDIREVGGFLSSYGIILGSTFIIKGAMEKAWKIKDGESRSYPLFKNIIAAAKNRHDLNYKIEAPNWGKSLAVSEDFQADTSRAKGFIGAINFVRRRLGKENMTNPTKAIEIAYRWTPVGVAGGIALYVGGMLLERFTRKHSSDVVEWINRQANANQPPDPDAFSEPAYVSSAKNRKHDKKNSIDKHNADKKSEGNPFFGQTTLSARVMSNSSS